jgi:hypothetical protein
MSTQRPGGYEHPACRREANKEAEEAKAVENAERASREDHLDDDTPANDR